MPKNLLQDMVKIKRLRNKARMADSALGPIQTGPRALQPEVKEVNNKDKSARYTLWLVAIVSLVFFLFALSYLFSKATVVVNPKMEDVVLNENLSASRDGNSDVLPFDLVVISGEENKIIQTTLEKDISQKAEGVVMIYNTFSFSPQRLDIDTRLEGSNGKIYKTKTKTTVPGVSKTGTPGSVEVSIYAGEAGVEYNSLPLDFTIFGFKGTPKYSKFYARSEGEISGGLKGKFPSISETEKISLENELQVALLAKLFKKAADQTPSGFILFKDAAFLSTDDSSIDFTQALIDKSLVPGFTSSKDNMLPIKLGGTLYGLLFDEQKLTKKIAEDNIENYDGSAVHIPNIRDLTFSLSKKDNISFGDARNINFNLSGTAKIVWKFDADSLARELLGKSKKDFSQVLSQYPNIDSALLSISPIWVSSLPGKATDINVIVNYPK